MNTEIRGIGVTYTYMYNCIAHYLDIRKHPNVSMPSYPMDVP